MRRPLAFICLIICLAIFGFVNLGPYGRDSIKKYEEYSNELNIGSTIQISGKVVKKEVKNNNQIIYLKNVSFTDITYPFNNKIGVICYLSDELMPELGSFVMLSGTISEFKTARNEGEFDLRKYYFSLGYIYPIYEGKLIAKSKDYNSYQEWLYKLKSLLSKAADNVFTEDDAGVIKAMLLGEKNDLNSELKSLYQKSGISHILSISGLHISMLGFFIYNILKKLRLNLYIAIFISSFVMINYALLVGTGISTLRALIMFLLIMLSFSLKRTYDLPTALSFAAALVMLSNIFSGYSSAFFLSFFAVFGIAVFSKSLRIKDANKHELKCLNNYGLKCLNNYGIKLLNNLLSSISVSYFTMPILLYYYYEYPLYSVLLNLLIIPLMSILLLFAFPAIIISFLNLSFAKVLALPCHIILKIYEEACDFTGKLPFNQIIIGKPDQWKIIIFYLITFSIIVVDLYIYNLNEKNEIRRLTLSRIIDDRKNITTTNNNKAVKNSKEMDIKKKKLKFPLLLKFLLMFLAIMILFIRTTTFKMYLLDVGQGDAIFISYKSMNYMIDGGSSSKTELAEYTLVPFLKSKGISRIDYWFVSHPDNDHISGLVEMLEDESCNIAINRLLLPDAYTINEDAEELIELSKKKNIEIEYVKQGDKLEYDDCSLVILNPSKGEKTEDVNTYSEVILLKYKDFKMLLTGDSTVKSESKYMDYCLREGIDLSNLHILKVAHHGSSSSSSKELISLLKPKISLISCGENNSYGHPSKEVINRLNEENSLIYNTMDKGEICLSIKKDKCSISFFLYD